MTKPRKHLNKVAPQAKASQEVNNVIPQEVSAEQLVSNQRLVALSSILNTGFHISSSLIKEYGELKVSQEDIDTLKNTPMKEWDERLHKIIHLSNCLSLVGDIIHPGYKVALDMFTGEDNARFIKESMARYKLARKNNNIAPCECCKEEGDVDEKTVEPVDESVAK